MHKYAVGQKKPQMLLYGSKSLINPLLILGEDLPQAHSF